jgi:hypothetical protein
VCDGCSLVIKGDSKRVQNWGVHKLGELGRSNCFREGEIGGASRAPLPMSYPHGLSGASGRHSISKGSKKGPKQGGFENRGCWGAQIGSGTVR